MEDGEDGHSVWHGALQAIKDPKVYMLILLQFSLLVGMAYVSISFLTQPSQALTLDRPTSSQALSKLLVMTELLLSSLPHHHTHWPSLHLSAILFTPARPTNERSTSQSHSAFLCSATSSVSHSRVPPAATPPCFS